MATATEYSQGLLDQEVEPIEAPSYEANTTELNVPTDTVSGQMDSLLDKDSQWMRRADTKGKQYANTRGLLNSSIGGQAAQAAAIDAALPIAQQDASSYLAQRLTNQDATNKALGMNAEFQSKANISDASNKTSLQNNALSNLSSIEKQQASDAAALERTNIGEAGATERASLGEAGALERLQLSELSALERTQLGEEGANARNEASIAANKILNDTNVAADDRLRFTNYYSTRNDYQLRELARLAEHPDLAPEEKLSRINEINASYIADINLVSSLYNVPLDMVG